MEMLQVGAGQSILSNKDVKIMKTCTIIFIGTMILALKVLVMFTLSMGTLTLESAIFIYSWMPPHMALVTGVFIFLVNFNTIFVDMDGVVLNVVLQG